MSHVGNCYDNAVAESFFDTLKAECVTSQFAAHALARTIIFEYIEVWYNRKRLHSSLSAILARLSSNNSLDFNCVY